MLIRLLLPYIVSLLVGLSGGTLLRKKYPRARYAYLGVSMACLSLLGDYPTIGRVIGFTGSIGLLIWDLRSARRAEPPSE